MPTGRTRPRVERAQSSSNTDAERDFRGTIREALPALSDYIRTHIETDADARRMVMALAEQDLARSRAGDQDELLLRLKAVREAGSPILLSYWEKVYKPR